MSGATRFNIKLLPAPLPFSCTPVPIHSLMICDEMMPPTFRGLRELGRIQVFNIVLPVEQVIP